MRVAFVGVKRKYQELDPEYRALFNEYHLELPYYFARDGGNEVTITTVDHSGFTTPVSGSVDLSCRTEKEFVDDSTTQYDVVVHWRKWFPELYRPEAINVINCQDHSFNQEWKDAVNQARVSGKLSGILCFPTWHKRNLALETGLPLDFLIDGLTLGVDTEIYRPVEKDPYKMLWASDPGRGLDSTLELAINLWRRDRRFILHVCVPDYVGNRSSFSHPAIAFHGNVPNGPKLWDLFNTSGILPYTSCFKEPSSRAHRQAQAAGAMVFYPPDMGSPSELIESGRTGIVAPIQEWADRIGRMVASEEHREIGRQAREFAVSENWAVQAERFNRHFERLLAERKC